MYKGIITSATAVSANTNIPFILDMNTNSNTENNSNSVSIKSAGYYNVISNLVVTGVAAGNISAQLFANGVAIPEAVASATSAAATDLITLNLSDAIRVTQAMLPTYANISVQLSATGTINAGSFIIQKVR